MSDLDIYGTFVGSLLLALEYQTAASAFAVLYCAVYLTCLFTRERTYSPHAG